MSDGSIGPVQDVHAVGGAGLRAVGRAGRDGAAAGGRPYVPGLDEFDRVELRSASRAAQTYAKFVVHPETGVVSIKIIDARTDTVIREMPPDEVMKVIEELQAYLKLHRHRGG
ncbi:MAG TPA: flagellar protein FlaG [Chloroflexota bacterium]|nr:flagellar protein FlaG [Chloroflexota bacterium]